MILALNNIPNRFGDLIIYLQSREGSQIIQSEEANIETWVLIPVINL